MKTIATQAAPEVHDDPLMEVFVGTGADETYVIDSVDDLVIEAPGGGTDRVLTTLQKYTLPANVENLTYIGSGGFVAGGNDLDNVIIGQGGNDFLSGGLGRDTLLGQGGDDWLDGGAGVANQMQGGAGDDTYVVRAVGDTIVEFSGEGVDTVRTDLARLTLRANVENLIYIGSGGFTGGGNDLDNVIIGQGGNDILSGGLGRDTLLGQGGADWLDGGAGVANQMQGGAGDDTYVVRVAGDTIVEWAGEGVDTVRTALSVLTLAAHVENLTFTGSGSFLGVGNAQNNAITGGVGADVLAGRDGDDTLSGGSGAANTLTGGRGDDTFVVQVVGDNVVEYAGEGTDTVRTTLASYTLHAAVENLIHTGSANFRGVGNASANTIMGGDGDDILYGADGGDSLYGGAGWDRLTGGYGSDLLDGGAGVDTVDYTGQALPVRIDLTAGVALNAGQVGDDTLVGIENATGGWGWDLLIGDTGANELNGREGNDALRGMDGSDWLEGGSGQDTLEGGPGDDFYRDPEPGDTLVEFAGEGIDSLWVEAIDYTLPAHFENLYFRNPGVAHSAYGNDEDNVIEGGDHGDMLAGGAGDDILLGGFLGDDVLRGDGGDDLLVGSDGVDTAVMSGVANGYTAVRNGDGSVTITDTAAGVNGDDGVDTLFEVEFVRFSDGAILNLSTLPPPAPAPLPDAKAGGDDAWILPAIPDEAWAAPGGAVRAQGPFVLPGADDALPPGRIFAQEAHPGWGGAPADDGGLFSRPHDWLF